MTNDWLVTLKFKNMPDDADESSMKTFTNILLEQYDADVLYDTEIVKIERLPE